MKIAIMQPYLFPYIGYWQLINASDVFIIYDDVNYIKQGWINRNKILVNNKEHLITIYLKKASSFKLINQIEIQDNKEELTKTISQAYRTAPFYDQAFPIIKNIFSDPENNLARFLINSIKKTTQFLQINTIIEISSNIIKNQNLNGEEKVIDICQLLKGTEYINAIGGRNLYSATNFKKKGIELKFLKSNDINYKQLQNPFIPWLSMIDIMMFNSISKIKQFLNQYKLV